MENFAEPIPPFSPQKVRTWVANMSNYLTWELMEVTAKRENQIKGVQEDMRKTNERIKRHLPIAYTNEHQGTHPPLMNGIQFET